jgi:hypothetical protein
MGDDLATFFWIDSWLDRIPLSERFMRLYDLEENRSGLVAEMSALGWERSKGRRGCSRDSCGRGRRRC